MYNWVHGALGYVLVLLKAKLDAPVQLVYKGVLLFVFNCGEEKCVTKMKCYMQGKSDRDQYSVWHLNSVTVDFVWSTGNTNSWLCEQLETSMSSKNGESKTFRNMNMEENVIAQKQKITFPSGCYMYIQLFFMVTNKWP